jgi:hypothetical protein
VVLQTAPQPTALFDPRKKPNASSSSRRLETAVVRFEKTEGMNSLRPTWSVCPTPPMNILRLPVLSSLLPALAFADSAVELDQAVRRLQTHSSYAWEITVFPANVSVWESESKIPDPDSKSGVRSEIDLVPAPIKGVTVVDQGSVLWASLDLKDTLYRGWMAAVIRDGRGVAETSEGWLPTNAIERAIAALPPPPAEQQIPFLKRHSLRTGRLMLALRPPAEELSALLAGSNPPMQAGKTIVATLTEATAKKFVFDHRYRDGDHPVKTNPVFAQGRLTIWLKDGEVVKYEVTVETDAWVESMRYGKMKEPLTKTTTLSKFDRATVEIPTEALAKLESAGRDP